MKQLIIRQAAVIGAGVMGSGIAAHLAMPVFQPIFSTLSHPELKTAKTQPKEAPLQVAPYKSRLSLKSVVSTTKSFPTY